jgi:hypothetical protein
MVIADVEEKHVDTYEQYKTDPDPFWSMHTFDDNGSMVFNSHERLKPRSSFLQRLSRRTFLVSSKVCMNRENGFTLDHF